MNTSAIDALNIALMVTSAVFAFFFPFELFLFSYAVLGPLHYLTELSWLRDKQYFVSVGREYLVLVAGTVFSLLAGFSGSLSLAAAALFFTLVAAVVLVAVRDAHLRIVLYAATIVLGLLFQSQFVFLLIFALLLPTLIHVLVFTGAFILHGALRNKSVLGYLSLLTFITCISVLAAAHHAGYTVSTYAHATYQAFELLNSTLLYLTHGSGLDIYTAPAALSLMSVIAFSYTYHYLNWFSKTSLIKWHRVPARRLVLMGVLWALSVALYIYNYKLGLGVLLSLSLLHVVLEFPLNYRTIAGIYTELRTRFMAPSAKM